MTRRAAVRLAGLVLATVLTSAGCGDGPSGEPGSDSPGTGSGGDVDRVPGQVVRADEAALSPDGGALVAGCLDDLCVWDTGDGSLRSTYDGGTVVAWSPDGDLIATDERDGDRDTIVLLSPDDGRVVRTLDGHPAGEANEDPEQGITTVAFGPGGDLLASAGHDGTVRLWSVADGATRGVLRTASDAPDQLSFSPDGERLAVAGPDAPTEVWDIPSGDRVGTLGAEPQGAVSFSPDGRLIATATRDAGSDTGVRLWDAASLREDRAFPDPVHAFLLAFSPDGETLAVTQSDDDAVLLWPVAGGDVRRLTGHEEPPRGVLWAPDGSALYTLTGTEGVLAWDSASGDLVRRFEVPLG
ncbi:MAG: repeat, subgroup [Nocardioides sp.]|nr:repeat, subgroup [Nocardioides sp.]